MAYYDQGYKVDVGYLPKFGDAVLEGLKSGQDMRAGVLKQQALQQEMQQGALKQQQDAAQQEAIAHARGAFNVRNAQDKQAAYSRYRQDMISKGHETPEGMPEQYTPDMESALDELVRGGQKFGDLTTTAASDREFGLRERELAAARAERQAVREEAAQARKDSLDASRNKPMSPEAELEEDFKAGRISEDIYKRSMAKKISPTETTYKQFQLQAASFADRMTKAEGYLQPFEKANIDPINNTASALGKIPFAGNYLENEALSSDQQLYRNAASEWIRSKLRKESGSAIGDAEMDKEYRTYFPVPGDSAKVVKQKAELRKNNTASMIKQASGAYEEQYLGEEPGQTSSAPAMGATGGKVIMFDEKGNIVQ